MIGVLALQGDFEKHKIILDKIGVNSLYVKSALDLARTDALIIPGGESSARDLTTKWVTEENDLGPKNITFPTPKKGLA